MPEKILKSVGELPEIKQLEVLDFIEYLKVKSEKEEKQDWSDLSIAAAMKDQLDEPSLYSMDDVKESFR